MAEEGLGLDVVSGGELYTALKAGFDPEKIHFHGNNKTQDELNMALDNGVGVIVMDNLDEMKRLDQLAAEKGVTAQVSMRIKPESTPIPTALSAPDRSTLSLALPGDRRGFGSGESGHRL